MVAASSVHATPSSAAGLVSATRGVVGIEAIDPHVAEEALRVRLRLREAPRQVGQARAQHEERQVALAGLVAGLAQRAELFEREVLHLVDEQRGPDLEVAGSRAEVDGQVGEVGDDRPGVGASRSGSTSIPTEKLPSGAAVTENDLKVRSARWKNRLAAPRR